MMVRFRTTMAFATLATLSAILALPSEAEEGISLQDLLSLKAQPTGQLPDKLNSRQEQLVLSAKKLGTAGGFSEYAAEVNRALEAHSSALDKAYYFQYILIPTGSGAMVLPPVVEEYGPEVTLLDNGAAMEQRDARLEIVKPARLIAHHHTWRSYLYLPVEKVVLGDSREWPETNEEQALWQHTLTTAWQSGRKQAAALYNKRFSELEADFIGMMRYLEYVEKGMLREIFVAGNELAVETSANGTVMQIGGRFVRITRQARFNGNVDEWKPVVIPIDWERVHDDS